MTVRAAIGRVLGVIGGLLVVLLVVTAVQLKTASDRAGAEANRTRSFKLGEGLRQSSNDLTRMARLYVSTGEARYRNYYQRILDIRNGTAPRPVDYDNAYWDRVIAGTEPHTAMGRPRALLDLLRDADFTPKELHALEAGKTASDQLAVLEKNVMDTAGGRPAPAELLKLEDNTYNQAKAKIMASIQRMIALVDARTAGRVSNLRDRTRGLIVIQLALIALMALASIATLIAANRRVVRPLKRLTGVTREIAAGDYDQRVEIESLQELEELGDRFNEMGEAIQLDVTARREAEAAARAADAAKSHFLATMSHEIRTPLNAVLGMSEILRESPLDADQRDCVETISTSGDHLLGVINDILDFSKIESGMLELDEQVFDLRSCLEDALDVTAGKAAEKGLDLVVDVAAGTPEIIRGDRGRIRQILVNYVSNAIKFTERGEVIVGVSAEGSKFTVTVQDSGIGIPADRLDRLFRSFSQVDATTTRRYGGTGLGLAISKRLAELMGGEVAVASEPGVGSTFSFTFMAEADPAWTVAPRPEAGTLAGRSVLIVDDNDANRRILRAAATTWGMTVTDTALPSEALTLVDDGAAFDLAVVDYLMPEMDGVALAAALSTRVELPILLLSSARRTARSDSNIDLVMTKPVRRAALLEAFRELLSGDAPPRGRRTEARSGTESRADDPVSPLKILLAEDNLANQKVAQRMLRSLGYVADIVGTGALAVDAVQRERYDLVLMDVHMPEMDGLEATRLIRALPPAQQPRIFAMTASALDSERQACLDAGMERHLAKPISRAGLETALAEVAEGVAPAATPPSAVAAEPPAAEEEPAPDDNLTLAELAEQISAEGVVEMIDAIVADAPTGIGALRSSIADGDAALLRRQAHTMKSNTAMVGAMALSDLCADVEALAKAEQLAEAAPQVDALVTRYEAFAEELTAARADWT